MLGNSIGPAINFKLKTLPLPFLVETPESSPYKRIFKFDCAIPNTTIKYEIIDYPCVQDRTKSPTTVYTTNQEITAIRPKKIKLIASKAGYKDSNIVFVDLQIKRETGVDFIVGYSSTNFSATVTPSQVFLVYDSENSNNNQIYTKCDDTSTITSLLSFQYWAANKWNLASNTGQSLNITLSTALSVRSFFSGNSNFGYLSGTPVIKYIKPRFPRPTIVQSFTGRPAVVSILKEYEGATNASATILVNDSKTNSKIYYTTDGTDPTSASNIYTAPLIMNNDATLKAICLSNNFDGTIAASYINVGEVHYAPGVRSVYTPSPSVSAVTILGIGGGGMTSWRCSNLAGATTAPAKAGIAARPSAICSSNATLIVSQGNDGTGMITRLNTNTTTTSTFYITAGVDTTTTNDTTGDPTYIAGSDRVRLTGNIINNISMINPNIWNYALTAMKLAPIINGAWAQQGVTPYLTSNVLNKYDYNLEKTLSEISENISNMTAIFPIDSIGISTYNYNNKTQLPLMDKAGVFIIEHYKD
jgi:hypothetical protein